MELTPSVVQEGAAEYGRIQPLATVEGEHREMLPEMLASGEFGWRDPEWVVQWFYRRFLGAYPDAKRRAGEDAYDENTYEDVAGALEGTVEADDVASKLEHLRHLHGVDVPVASAFLHFLHPESYVVCSEREWSTMRAAGELDAPYPDPPSVADYRTYLDACRAVADRCDCSLWTLYRALWALGEERVDRTDS